MEIETIKKIDKYVGDVICLFLGIINKLFLSRKIKKKEIKKILIIQLWGVGETILIFPALKAIKEKYPNSKISVLTTERVADVFNMQKELVDEVKVIDLSVKTLINYIYQNIRRYNIVIDFEEYLRISTIISFFCGKKTVGFSHGIRSFVYTKTTKYDEKRHVVQLFLDLVRKMGIKYDTNELIEFESEEKNKKFVEELLKVWDINETNKIIGICPGAAESARCRMWPKERFAKLVEKILINNKENNPQTKEKNTKNKIIKPNSKILFIGHGKEEKLIEDIIKLTDKKYRKDIINSANRVNLKQLFYLIKKCDYFVSNDTGPMHIAAAQKVKTIGLFGPNTPLLWAPYGKENLSLFKPNKNEKMIINKTGYMPEENRSMLNITVEDVYNALKAIQK